MVNLHCTATGAPVTMTARKKTVFILGAGFTRAFLPRAPLLIGDFNGEALLAEMASNPYARNVLEVELALANPGATGTRNWLDLERLMTRLQGRMPYDFDTAGANSEMDVLLSRLKTNLVARLSQAKPTEPPAKYVLARLASYCLRNGVDCITFNYDDVLDEALWHSSRIPSWLASDWSPSAGYGFFCRPSEVCVRDTPVSMHPTTMGLYKLHGSLNWRVKKGQPRPYGVDAILHHEQWWQQQGIADSAGGNKIALHVLDAYLEPEPFIVPPVLAKADLVEHPVLRVVWGKAAATLRDVERLVFVGYSLPLTDIAAATLFRENVRPSAIPNMRVVDYAADHNAAQRKLPDLLRSYEKVFPGLQSSQVDFAGAYRWALGTLHDEDFFRLQGSWKAIEAIVAGEAAPEATTVGVTLTVSDSKFEITNTHAMGLPERGTFRLNVEGPESLIELSPLEGGNTKVALYKLGAKALELSIDLASDSAPTSFYSTTHAGHMVVKFNKT